VYLTYKQLPGKFHRFIKLVSQVAIIISIVTLPLYPIRLLTGLLTVILLVGLITHVLEDNFKVRLDKTDIAFIVFTLSILLSCITSINHRISFSYFEKLILKPAILYFSIKILVKNNRELTSITYSLALGYTAIGILNLMFGRYSPMNRFMGIYPSPTILSKSSDLVIPVLMSLIFFNNSVLRYVSLVGCITYIVCLTLSMTRTSWLINILSANAVIILGLNKAKLVNLRKLILLYIAIVCVIILATIITPKSSKRYLMFRFKKLIDIKYLLTEDPAMLERISIYKTAIELIKLKPITGWGFGRRCINYAEQTLGSKWFRTKGLDPIKHHAHNIALEILIESGIISLISFFAFVYIYLRTAITKILKERRVHPIEIGLVVSVINILTHGIVSNILQTPIIAMLIAHIAISSKLTNLSIEG